MKTYFKSSEIAHVWAHGLAKEGRCPSAMLFTEGRFYSYSTCIAEKLDIKGKEIYLVDQTSYSATTSGHQSSVYCAIPGEKTKLPVFGTYGNRDFGPRYRYNATSAEKRDALKEWGRVLISRYLEEAEDCARRAERRRAAHLKDADLSEAAAWLDHARTVKSLCGLRTTIPENIEGVAEAQKRAAKRERAARRRAEKQREKDAVESLEKWVAGQLATEHLPRLEKVFFRVVNEGTEIETSKGAFIPYEAGRSAFRFAFALREKGWQRNGKTFPVGSYQIDRINAAGVVAGCHIMRWEEITAFAEKQGWVTTK